jgi:DNA-directed RNA polymerase subunit RPC12/RpoP
MDLIFNCPKCGQELEVDASGVGEEINCPACGKKISIPAADSEGVKTKASGDPAAAPSWGAPSVNAIAASAAAKESKHLKVPLHNKPSEKLVVKQAVSLEAAAKETDKHIRVKTIRHTDCVESGRDKFDETVAAFLASIGEGSIVSVTPLNYGYVDIATQKPLADYAVMIIYRG